MTWLNPPAPFTSLEALIRSPDVGVHLVGEASSRSFTIALAARRGGLDNIYASHDSHEAEKHGPNFTDKASLIEAIEAAESNASNSDQGQSF